jgi:ceramide glucosyltransferase
MGRELGRRFFPGDVPVLMLTRLWLLIAAAGLASCTGFLALAVVGVVRFRRGQAGLARRRPPVTLLKPLCGMEPDLEANIESFFLQDYPDYEIVFGMRDDSDPALEVVQRLKQRYPERPVSVVFSGPPDRPNAKVCSLVKMYAATANDYLIISDSDVHVGPNYIAEVIGPLLDSRVGLVTCVYRGVPTGGVWSRLEALGMSVEMTAGVMAADMLEGMRFALGPTMATRREVLDRIGGLGVLADYCADDYVLGNLVHKAGWEVVLSRHVIDHVVIDRSFSASMLHQLRWMKSTRFSRPNGHIGSGLTFAMPFGLLGLAAGIATGRPVLGLVLLACAWLNRVIMAVVVGWGVVRDERSLAGSWAYPVRDLIGFCLWSASFWGRTIVWRNQNYRLEPGGRMVRLGDSAPDTASGTIAVDKLA